MHNALRLYFRREDIIRPPDELFRSFTIVGQYVYKAVLEIHRHYPFIFVDTFTIMPNHIHLLLRIDNMIEAENSVVFSKTNHFNGYRSNETHSFRTGRVFRLAKVILRPYSKE